jgi:hypothetical protein
MVVTRELIGMVFLIPYLSTQNNAKMADTLYVITPQNLAFSPPPPRPKNSHSLNGITTHVCVARVRVAAGVEEVQEVQTAGRTKAA